MSASASEDIFRAIDRLYAAANDMVCATESCQEDVQQVLRALTQVNMSGMYDVLILARNNRGTGAMKIARSMFEVSLIAEYLEKNPTESVTYQEFAYVLARRWAQSYPGKLTTEQLQQTEAEYNRVKTRFTNSKGRVQKNWSVKTIKQIADEIGRTDLYEVMYGAASTLHHVNVLGLLGHELDWVPEALRVAQGSLLQTLCSLYNSSDLSRFAAAFSALTKEFEEVWTKHVSER